MGIWALRQLSHWAAKSMASHGFYQRSARWRVTAAGYMAWPSALCSASNTAH